MTRESHAVSPVVAVILMVAVTVILSAAVGAFVFNLGQSNSETKSQSIGVRTTADGASLIVDVITGEADKLRILINGTNDSTLQNPSPGDSLITRNATEHSTISVIAITDGQATVVSTENPLSNSPPIAPTDGLIAHYKLNGDATDSVGTADGTNYGVSWVDGVQGQAGEFVESETDYIDTGTKFDVDSVGTLTYSAWIRDDGVGSEFNILSNYDGAEGTLWRSEYNGGKWQFWVNGVVIRTNVEFNNNTRIHVATTWNGSTAKFYKDGQLVYSETISPTIASSTATTKIGQRGDNTAYADGLIDDIRIYNRSLTEQEVKDLYNATK